MTDQLFTGPHSTWEAEAKALRDLNTELALQALASDGQAEEAHEARLIAEAEAKTLRARVAELEEILRVDPWQVGFAHWKALRARIALEAKL